MKHLEISASLNGRRHATDGGGDTAVVPVGEEVSGDEGSQFMGGQLFGIVASHDFCLSPGPHAFAFGVVMAAASSAVHALDEAELIQSAAKQLTGVLTAPVAVAHCTP